MRTLLDQSARLLCELLVQPAVFDVPQQGKCGVEEHVRVCPAVRRTAFIISLTAPLKSPTRAFWAPVETGLACLLDLRFRSPESRLVVPWKDLLRSAWRVSASPRLRIISVLRRLVVGSFSRQVSQTLLGPAERPLQSIRMPAPVA